MSVIPRYWYCEPVSASEAFQCLPTQMVTVGPEPCVGQDHVIFDPATGEVYGEAILMSALPWPRFCCFTFGKQLVLPHRSAVALERYERELLVPVLENLFPQINDKKARASLKYRVEVFDCERFAVTPVVLGQWLSPFNVCLRGASAPLPAPLPPGEGGRGPVKAEERSVP